MDWIKQQIKQFKEPFPEPDSVAYKLWAIRYDISILKNRLTGKQFNNPEIIQDIESAENNKEGDL